MNTEDKNEENLQLCFGFQTRVTPFLNTEQNVAPGAAGATMISATGQLRKLTQNRPKGCPHPPAV